MLRTRVIPSLTIQNRGVYRTVHFKNPKYVGDPTNALKIFNDREVDEVLIVDFSDQREWAPSQLELLQDLASEAFMPLAYSGKLKTIGQARSVLNLGYEKVAFNTAVFEQPGILREAADEFGSSSVIASIDVQKGIFGKYQVMSGLGRKKTGLSPVEHARWVEDQGAGEILLTAIHCDGTMSGYDEELISAVNDAVTLPVIAMGGAGSLEHMKKTVEETGVSAVAAGSYFVYHGRHRAVLINYPDRDELERAFP